MGSMLTVYWGWAETSVCKSGSLKLLVLIFIYNPIHKLIEPQFKTNYVSWSHCLYLGVASRSLADVDMKSLFLLLLEMEVFSKTPRKVQEILLSYMQLIKVEAGFIARENTVKMQWMKAYASTLYLQVQLKKYWKLCELWRTCTAFTSTPSAFTLLWASEFELICVERVALK